MFGATVVAVATLVAAGCLAPTGTPKALTLWDAPDPAGVRVGTSSIQVYSTNTPAGHVPTFTTTYPTPGITGAHDALPALPGWVKVNSGSNQLEVWAPTVRAVAGRYVMFFSASRSAGTHCVGSATSPTAGGTFAPTGLQLCDANGVIGMLDPQLFVDADGSVWLLVSRQWAANGAFGGSEIDSYRMSADGLTPIGGPYRLVTFADTVTANGSNSGGFVENPAMVRDPYNGYDLIVSFGTWNTSGYHTVEIPCASTSGSCIPSRGGSLASGMAGPDGPGGASLVADDTPVGNVMLFHGRTAPGAGIRIAYVQGTDAVNLNNN